MTLRMLCPKLTARRITRASAKVDFEINLRLHPFPKITQHYRRYWKITQALSNIQILPVPASHRM